MATKKPAKGQLKGDVFLLTDDRQAFASAQLELLRAIDECGSISKAARAVGISYKTAWDRIDAMNNLSSQPLVSRAAGGAQGGGTELTALGQRVLEGFAAVQQEHRNFIARLGDRLHSISDFADFIKRESIMATARNQLAGRVKKIARGKVSAEVEVDIGTGQAIYAVVTRESIKDLRLAKGDDVIAMVKAPSVMIATDPAIQTSARNRVTGVISRINQGSVNSEVILEIGDGKTICAIITAASTQALDLQAGQTACAVFTAPSVNLVKGQ